MQVNPRTEIQPTPQVERCQLSPCSIKKVQDTLAGAESDSLLQTIWNTIKELFFKIFFCFKKEQKAEECFSIGLMMVAQAQLDTLERKFPEEKGKLNRVEFQKWWKNTFEVLDKEVQKRILLQHIKIHAPDKETDPHKWALNNFAEREELARLFVVNLEPEVNNRKRFIPEEHIPDYLHAVKSRLTQEIRALKRT